MLIDIEGIVKFSDELHKFHIGEVVDNQDPKKLGRVKLRVKDILTEDISNDDLPWAYPLNYSPTDFYVPQVGEKLKVVFVNGDIYHPEYRGYLHTTENHDNSFDADYPNTFGIQKQGLIVRYNMKQELLEVIAKNGSYLKMDKEGNTTFFMKKDLVSNADENTHFYSKKNFRSKTDEHTFFECKKFEVDAQEDINISTKAKLTVTVTSDISFSANGKIDLNAQGNINISSSSGKVLIAGTAGTDLGHASSITNVYGTTIMLGGAGGSAVAVVGSQAVGTGNQGSPVVSTITTGSTKVFAV